MEAADILKKVRRIEIKTRGLSKQIFAGEYHSAFKGKGMAFSEVREYQYGDDIRNIEWNVTARFNHPFVKIFEEERELTVILIVDFSNSKDFGTQQQLKRNLVTEICAVLAFSASTNKDNIGVIFFTDKVEKFIPPKKGKKHILRIILELINFQPTGKGTNISEALRYFTNAIKKRSTAFLISDFIDSGFENAVKIANKKHDLIAIKIYDERETKLPPIGIVKFKDAETGELKWVDTSNSNVRKQYADWWTESDKALEEIFKRSKVDSISLRTDEDYIRPLIKLFKKRGGN